MTTLRVKIINAIVKDAWYRSLIGKTVLVVEKGGDYVVVDPAITNDHAGEFNNSGLICKDDAMPIKSNAI